MDDRDDIDDLPSVWAPLFGQIDCHIRYSDQLRATTYHLFYGQGSLTGPERHFLAIMASARYHCEFLKNVHMYEFERRGGNMEWLKGIKYVTKSKIPHIDGLNVILAHQPWRTTAEALRDIVLLPVEHVPKWTLCETASAAVIMAQTHTLCSLIYGIGPANIQSNSRHPSGSGFDWAARDKENKAAQQMSEVEELLKRMADIKTSGDVDPNTNTRYFKALTADNEEASGSESPDRSDEAVFSSQPSFSYVDFASRTDTTRTFKSHEFTWEHGFSILEDISFETANVLDKKFTETQNLTYGFMGSFDNVDTTGYRTAIWNYIQALYGIRHDDYDYSAVNQLLSREMKTFIKNVACSPHRLTNELRESVMREFKNSEKVHVVLMITEARLQAVMLWLTRAISNFYVLANNRHDSRELD